jgi:hypothetical protein
MQADKSMRSLLLTLLAIGTINAVADTWLPYPDGRIGGCWAGSAGRVWGCTAQTQSPHPLLGNVRDRVGRIPTGALSDVIFDGGFDEQNGGTSCDTATVLGGGLSYRGDTTAAPNWMSSFGPLFSPSSDVVYVFVAGAGVNGSITPTASNYEFAMYLIPSCVESGSEPSPIGATATIGTGIDLSASGVRSGNTYYLVVTGTASGGAGADGAVIFTTPLSIAVSPSF